MSWLIRDKYYETSRRGMIMGIVNVTPDSFSDGGRYFDVARAVQHGVEMIRQGADILDIGGESTRPGAEPVSAEEELRRVLPVIGALRAESRVLISIDTSKASVAEAAMKAGADIINDVSGLVYDPHMMDVARETKAGIVLMHMKGEPRTMQANPTYVDVVLEVGAFFEGRMRGLEQAGIDIRRVILDPGIGFGKNLEHNLALLRALPDLRVRFRPLLLGVSRKSMISSLIGSDKLEDRAWPTVALTSYARERGVGVMRVHDVKFNLEAMRMTEAIRFGMAS
jgi:dihydropteroate synthase